MTDTEQGFEATLAELEEIVRALEADSLELDESLQLFERGVECLRRASGLLDRAHGRVEELVAEATGRLGLVPLGDVETEPGVSDSG